MTRRIWIGTGLGPGSLGLKGISGHAMMMGQSDLSLRARGGGGGGSNGRPSESWHDPLFAAASGRRAGGQAG